MIRPTIRTVLLFAGGIPLSLIAVIYDPDLWLMAASYGVLVLVIAASDLTLAAQPGMLDVKILALPVLRHRLTMSPSAEIEGLTTDRILREVLDQTPAPR